MAVAQPVAAVRKTRQKPKPQVPARGVVPQHDQQQIQHIVAQNTQHRRHAGIRALQKPCRQQHGRRAAQEKRSVIHHHDLYVARLPQQHRIDKYMGQAVKHQKTRMHRQKTVKSAAQRLAVHQHLQIANKCPYFFAHAGVSPSAPGAGMRSRTASMLGTSTGTRTPVPAASHTAACGAACSACERQTSALSGAVPAENASSTASASSVLPF